MRNLQYWIGLLILAGCLSCNRPAPAPDSPTNDSVPPPELAMEMETTAEPVVPLRALPPGFVLDSAFSVDTATDHHTTLYFPQSQTDTKLNAQIRAYCEAEGAKNLPDTPREEYDNSEFSMWLISIEQRGDLLSMLFQDQSFYSGGAHYNHGYDALNIDLPIHRQLAFEDLMRFIGNKERIAFCEFVNGQNQKSPPITPEMLKLNLDFVISGELLQLCFDDFDLEPSRAILAVPLDDARAYMTARAIKILKL